MVISGSCKAGKSPIMTIINNFICRLTGQQQNGCVWLDGVDGSCGVNVMMTIFSGIFVFC